ncbi:FAD-dependent monooxygenase [Streptosporangium sandarakinum]|uniref:FAD-dependent monooxygenase n=1 Tax=Streptosporangium sandarakinum TaxID=1260955 RepID=UPI003435AE14
MGSSSAPQRPDLDEVFPLELRTSVPIPPWRTTHVTLLGDAAHAMSPAAGAGADLALRDAAALTAALAHGGPPIPALRSYEREMIHSGFTAVRISAANGTRVLGQDPPPSSPLVRPASAPKPATGRAGPSAPPRGRGRPR